jgi:hypothetical protein
MLEGKTVGDDTLCWRDGDADEWRPLKECPWVFAEKSAPKTAAIVEEKTLPPTGLETRLEVEQVDDGTQSLSAIQVADNLEFVAIGLAIFGWFGVAVVVVSVFNILVANEAKEAFTWSWVLAGIGAAVLGLMGYVSFKAGATLIRLQSRRLKFTANAIQFSAHRFYKCSVCRKPAERGQARCSSCGAEFKP